MNMSIFILLTVFYSLEKYEHVSRWIKVSTIKKKKRREEKRKKFITYKGKHSVKGHENT